MSPFWNLIYIFLAAAGFLLSLFFTPILRRIALGRGIVDRPEEERFHPGAVPLLGGAAIFLSFNLIVLTGLAAFLALRSNPGIAGRLPEAFRVHIPGIMSVAPRLVMILLGGMMIFILGLADDLRKLPAGVKFLVQVIVAVLLVAFGVKVTLFVPNPFFGALITVIWIVGITNAFNLLDNMDGLSAGVALVASIMFFAVTFLSGQLFVSTLLAVFIGVLAGFLRYNFPPAKIFMGDSGSLFLGFLLAVLTTISTYYSAESPTTMAIAAPLLILGVPIFDTVTVLLIRMKENRPLFKGDTNHFSHRLVALGMTVPQAVVFIYLICFGIGLGALLLNRVGRVGGIIILIQALVMFVIIRLLELKR